MHPLLAGILYALGASQVAAIDVYVSTNGSDDYDGGSSQDAFLTLERARDVVRELATSSMTEDITVHVASGTYSLSSPLLFDAADSGKNGFKVHWVGDDSVISGGLKLENWEAGANGVYSASVPSGLQSRNVYVDGWAANYARSQLANRSDFEYTETGMSWTDSTYDFLMTTEGIENGEVRFINSFTDRYAPIEAVGNRELIMKQPSWANQIIGYDTVDNANADFGVYVQNVLALLSDGGEFFYDKEHQNVYYKPSDGQDIEGSDAYLGVQETLLSISGSLDEPVHDISFEGLTFV